MAVSPKIQMVEYSQPVGPMKSEKKLTEDGLHICCEAHAMPYYTIREEVQQLPSSPTWQEPSKYHFQIIQTPPAQSSSALHRKPWILVLFTQQTCAQQLKDYWQQPKHAGNKEVWWKINGHDHSSPKRTQGVAPTAQTREEATLLMLIWLEECGLVEGS